MPIYEYRCLECGKASSVFTRSVNQEVEPECSHCASSNLRRLISSFAHHKSLNTIHQESGSPPGYADPSYYSDPRNIGRNVEDSFQKHGMEVPSSVQETIRAARDGELPKGMDL
jgi:putative FmdB family regulatory protein